jgi:hypothetical protein
MISGKVRTYFNPTIKNQHSNPGGKSVSIYPKIEEVGFWVQEFSDKP